jgi:hypothetical protein
LRAQVLSSAAIVFRKFSKGEDVGRREMVIRGGVWGLYAGNESLEGLREAVGIYLAASCSRGYPYKQQERTYSPAEMIGQILYFAFHWPVNAGLPEAPANPLLDASDAADEAEAEVTNPSVN